MRIAYVCADPGVPVFGRKGSSVHVQEVIRALRQIGAQIELFATRIDGEVPPELDDVHLHPLPPVGSGKLAAREQAALGANDRLRVLLERLGRFDLIYERYSLWSYAAMEYAQLLATPGLLEVNAPLIEEQAEHRGLVDRASAERVAQRAFSAATGVVAVSDNMAAYLDRYPALQDRLHIIPNGVDPNRFRKGLRPALPDDPGAFTVGFVGSLRPWHDLTTLVDAFAALHDSDPAARLLIVGDGPQRSSLERDLCARGLAHVTFITGAVDPSEVPAWVASLDVAVAPYPNLPNFYFSPLKVYEYMAAGVSVVASRIGQIASVIENGVTGLLYAPGNADALLTALVRLRTDPDLRHCIGRAARETVIQRHTWDSVACRILRLAGLEPEIEPVCEGGR